MRASRPTAGPAHAALHLIDADLDTAFPCGSLLGRRDPTDPLIPSQRRDIGPQLLGRRAGLDGRTKIGGQGMHRPAREFLGCHAAWGYSGVTLLACRTTLSQRPSSTRRCSVMAGSPSKVRQAASDSATRAAAKAVVPGRRCCVFIGGLARATEADPRLDVLRGWQPGHD